MWTLSVRPSRDSGLAPVDVQVRAQPGATVRDLAEALGRHFRPGGGGLLVVPTEESMLWPADRRLADCGLRSGIVLDAVTAPASWLSRPGVAAKRRATLRVVAGPDAGLTAAITGESATIGRAGTCTVKLSDPLVSRQHARVLLTPGPILVDEGSARGTSVGGTPVRRPTPVDWGMPIELGDTTFVLDYNDPSGSAETRILRPPRFGEPLGEDEVKIEAPPKKNQPRHFPWTMMGMPVVMGGGMLIGGMPTASWGTIIGLPLIMTGSYFVERRHEAKKFAEDLRLWREGFAEQLGKLDRYADAQRARALADHPGLAELQRRILTKHPTLWANRDAENSDPAYLTCRVGLGPVAPVVTSQLSPGGELDIAAEAREELANRRMLPDMPVCLTIGETGLVAVAGQTDAVQATARAMVLRLCADHSPADLSVAAVLSNANAYQETWLRWLPHAARRIGGLAPVAVGATDGQSLLERLSAADTGEGDTVCLVDEQAGVSRRVVEAVAAQAAQRRLRLIWLGRDPHAVPSNTDVVVDLTLSVPAPLALANATLRNAEAPRPVVVVAHRDRARADLVTSLDTMELGTAWKLARAMTNYTDEAAVLPPDTAIPGLVRLPDVIGGFDNLDDDKLVLERWAASRGLRAQIGAGVDGPVTLDLREDGPHGLVAGTTGSGKSELLQSLLCSLALNNPPSRMTFLLVDYKGGAAFRECADLPHSVGYITDLTPALVKRALISLTAELNSREEILAEYGAKDLIHLEREHPETAPPSLLICVDEFAALTAEVPDFVDGMVNIAQRGRSLGMHMLLATQRPAGVVTPQIKANTDLRIALRVAAAEDSNDVIDRKDAASISRRTPGRAWIRRTGHGTVELVQSAWVGAREEVSGSAQRVDIRPFTARDIRGDEGYEKTPATAAQVHERTDLDRMVTTIGEAFVRSGQPLPKKPWLPALPGELLLGQGEEGELLIGSGAVDEQHIPGTTDEVLRVRGQGGQVPIGLGDDPRRQTQPPLLLDYPHAGHVLVYGGSGSGKTELLRTITVAATITADGVPPHIYGLDFAGGGLGVLADWPGVGAIIGDQHIHRAARLIRMLRRIVRERNATMAAVNAADLPSLAAAGYPLPRIHVLIDNIVALMDAFDGEAAFRSYPDQLASMLQEGRRVGVHFTATAQQRTGLPMGMQSAFGQRMVLRMANSDDYSSLDAPAGVLTEDSPPGRGVLGTNEIQIATVGGAGGPLQQERLRALGDRVRARYRDQAPPPVSAMPARVPHGMLPPPKKDAVILAVEADHLNGVVVPLAAGPLLIAGRSGTGRTSILAAIAAQARRSDTPPKDIVLLGPHASAAPGQDCYDTTLSTLAAVDEWLPEWQRTRGDGWSLLLLDDAHLWHRAAESDIETAPTWAALTELVTASPGLEVAVVVASDPDEARNNQFSESPVQAARAARRGILLQPDYADTMLLGVNMPVHTVEPLTGTGRGLWCANGNTQVVHAVSFMPAEGAGP
ncbi:cell division protein FtsX [Kibdelosporangium aridum]|uniref:Cell division protein FtsX n=1 Tax=Kibdelosporangium aridum TaxID=2030 RepID=A0A428Z584_KIBAR|nr:FtsK/SpoIIIE domain-containing protein [Kibdelosporangium aridum]RSM81980.1 cell division protein FtsX [Kibdelosporangium aridum]